MILVLILAVQHLSILVLAHRVQSILVSVLHVPQSILAVQPPLVWTLVILVQQSTLAVQLLPVWIHATLVVQQQQTPVEFVHLAHLSILVLKVHHNVIPDWILVVHLKKQLPKN
jgi:hypothetical protein